MLVCFQALSFLSLKKKPDPFEPSPKQGENTDAYLLSCADKSHCAS